MSELALGGLLIGALVFLVLMGLHIAVALTAVGFAGIWLIRENIDMAMRLMYLSAYNGVAEFAARSVASIVFLQLAAAVCSGRMTRSDFLLRIIGKRSHRALKALEVFNVVVGALLFSLSP